MKILTALIVSAVLASCGFTKMTKNEADITWLSWTLFKDIKEVEADSEGTDFNFKMGHSQVQLTDAQAEAIMCGLMPETCNKSP